MAGEEHTISDVQIAVLANDISYIKTTLIKIETLVRDKYVTKDEFIPVRNIAYGFVALVLVTVVGALLALVVHK
jgi:hypothetical protein